MHMVAIALMAVAMETLNHFALLAIRKGKDAGYLLLFKIVAKHVLALGFLGIYYWRNRALRDFILRKLNFSLQRTSTQGKLNDTILGSGVYN